MLPDTMREPVIVIIDSVLTDNIVLFVFPIIWNIVLLWEIDEDICTGILKSNNRFSGDDKSVLAVNTVVGVSVGVILFLPAKNLKISFPSFVKRCIIPAALLPNTSPVFCAFPKSKTPLGIEIVVLLVLRIVVGVPLTLVLNSIPFPEVAVRLIREFKVSLLFKKVSRLALSDVVPFLITTGDKLAVVVVNVATLSSVIINEVDALAFSTLKAVVADVVPDPFTNKLLVAEPDTVKLPENLPVPFTSSLKPESVVVPIAKLLVSVNIVYVVDPFPK